MPSNEVWLLNHCTEWTLFFMFVLFWMYIWLKRVRTPNSTMTIILDVNVFSVCCIAVSFTFIVSCSWLLVHFVGISYCRWWRNDNTRNAYVELLFSQNQDAQTIFTVILHYYQNTIPRFFHYRERVLSMRQSLNVFVAIYLVLDTSPYMYIQL